MSVITFMSIVVERIKPYLKKQVFLRTIASSASVVVFGYLYSYIKIQVLDVLWLALFSLSACVVALEVTFYIRGIIRRSKKVSDARRRGAVITYSLPEFKELADEKMKVKLNKKQPFLKIGGLDNIGIDRCTRQVILGEVMLNRLEVPAQVAAVAHEFAHLSVWQTVRLVVFAFIAEALLLLWLPPTPRYIYWTVAAAVLFGIFCIISYWNEYTADKLAVKHTSCEAMISALEGTELPEKRDNDYEDHPSVNSRIRRLSFYK